jgi:hydroxymethylpyrimidine/phosphomethylpyrimidine kinase
MSSHNNTPTVLNIAGFDPYGGAGLSLDSKVIHQLGGYAFSVATTMTAQNSQGVNSTYTLPTSFFKKQLYTLLADVKVDAVKIGILGTKESVQVVIDAIEKFDLNTIVLDTVLVSSSGYTLLEKEAMALMKSELLSRVDLVTPNIPEVETLYNHTFDFTTTSREEAFNYFQTLGAKAVLFKGGHSKNSEAVDYLYQNSGTIAVTSPRVTTTHTHGTGCFYASAIAAYLALGENLEESVKLAKRFLFEQLQTAEELRFTYRDESKERKEPII